MPDKPRKNILLVDDEAIIAMSEAGMLQKHGYAVLIAYSGEQAIKTAAENPSLDLVLMDIDLGKGMDGTQAAEIILQSMDIPVLFLSSHTEPEVVEKTEKITSYGYVVKNSGETVLLASIRMAFKLHNAHKELRNREEDLGKSERKLNFIFESTPNAITITEMETGIVVDANKGIEWTGWSRDEVIGKSPSMLQTWVNPDEGEKIRNIIKAEGKLANHRVDFYKKDGSIAHALMNSVFIQINGKQHLLTVSNDITRLSESEIELKKAKEDLEGMNEELQSTVEELEATNEELQASNEEMEESKHDLESLLAEHKRTLEILRENEYFLEKSQEIGKIGYFITEFIPPAEIKWKSSKILDDIIGIEGAFPKNREAWVSLIIDPQSVIEYVKAQVIEKKEKFEIEYQIRRHSDGEARWVYSIGELKYDEGGNVTRIIGTVQDITDRKAVEKTLRQSEERYRTIFENSATANIIAAADTTILLANSNFVKLLGYSREELEGRMSWTSFILDEYLEKMKAYHFRRMTEPDSPPKAYEFKARMRSGEIRDFYMNVAMIPGSKESLGTLIDITDRVRAEEALKQSEERFKDLVRYLPETVYEADRQGTITYVNQTGLAQFGYTQEDIDGGLNVLSILTPQEHKSAIEKIGKVLQGEYLGLNEYMAVRKDGTTFPVLIHSSPILRDGHQEGFRGFLADITELKHAEQSLSETENRYHSIIESLPIGMHMYRLESDGRLVFDGANPAADRILGVDNSVFIGKTIEEAFPSLTATEVPRRYREVAETGTPWHREQIDYDESGIRGAFDVHAFRISDRFMAAAFTDITERKRAEKALKDSQQLLYTLYENVGAHIFMKDTSYRYIYANKKVCDLFGRELSEIVGKTDAEFFSKESVQEIMISDSRVIENGETVTREETNLAPPDGSYPRTYWTVKLPLRDSEGRIYALCGISTDITKLKETELALRESEDRWQFALEGAEDGIWDWNTRTDRVYFSHQWKAMLGYEDSDIGDTLKEWDSRVHPDDRDRVYAEINKHFEGVTPVYTSEHRVKCKNGEYKWILDRGKVVSRTPEGKPLRVIGTHTDISELKRNAEALGKAVSEKEALLRELQHRMKNSLAMISGIINLELDRISDRNLRDVLDNIKGRIGSLTNLYALLFQSDTVREVELGIYIKSIVGLLSDSYGAGRAINIKQSYDPLRVNTKNAAAWGLIVNELLTNSFKYAFPGGEAGTISISLKTINNDIVLAISDNGTGLPDDFDIQKPTGLGLLLVQTLTLQLKGLLTFKRGKENVFLVRAPNSEA